MSTSFIALERVRAWASRHPTASRWIANHMEKSDIANQARAAIEKTGECPSNLLRRVYILIREEITREVRI